VCLGARLDYHFSVKWWCEHRKDRKLSTRAIQGPGRQAGCNLKKVDVRSLDPYYKAIMPYKNIGQDNLNEILFALDRQIEFHGGSPIGLLVCGGTALAALGLIARTTKDVDVMAGVEETDEGLRIFKITRFPGWLLQAANTIARDFGLPEEWLNLGPASQMDLGLPSGIEGRLVKKSYGDHLVVYFIGRRDQIFFKLYAAVDRNDYHVQDLVALRPTDKEMEAAARWVLTQDVSQEFRLILKDFLKKHDHEPIADRI
jgi:hypothetical protein